MKKNIITAIMICTLSAAAVCSAADIPQNMEYITGGYAIMGAEAGDVNAQPDAKPNHPVYLDGFYMDRYEVSNGDYAQCVAAGECAEPTSNASRTRESYYGNVNFSRFPVVNVTWQDAADYCAYAGKRLPTEAEWERAARGADSDRIYSWGNSAPRSPFINTSDIPGDTEMPNSYPKGGSPFGIQDTIGNVSEWTSDWYSADYYSSEDAVRNPQGPASGSEKVVRGGSFETRLSTLHITNRYPMDPDAGYDTVGFRCAMDLDTDLDYDFSDEDIASVKDFAYISAGNENGIFLMLNPGNSIKGTLIGVIPNGSVVEILAGPVNVDYTQWYQIATPDGLQGWTLGSAISFFGK